MAPVPPNEPQWPIPRFDLRIEDLAHPGVSIFLKSIDINMALRAAVIASFKWLYTPETVPTNVQSILLVLRPMDGVAHTFGDVAHKQIHFSLDHIQRSAHRARDEILGVLVHEVVHCYQYNALRTCPGGLIEGIADYVRLRAELGPPHWKKSGGEKWDAGYEKTAYFLAWLEERYGDGTVVELNARMNGVKYDERIFKRTTGRRVGKLWRIYCAQLGESPSKIFPFRF